MKQFIENLFPPVQYLGIYKLNLQAPSSRIVVSEEEGMEVAIDPGPLELRLSAPVVQQTPPIAGMTMGEKVVSLPPDSYLTMNLQFRELDENVIRKVAALRISEVANLIELTFPGLVAAKVHEGAINTGNSWIWLPEGPVRLTAAPSRDATEVALDIGEKIRDIGALSDTARERFALASRWFRRGRESNNRIDKLLFWWTVLEVHPAEGTTDVVKTTANYLRDSLYKQLDEKDLRARLHLGPIAGMRGEVVHNGKAFVTADDEERFDELVRRLEAICVTSLRLLAGIEPGTDLEEYINA